MLSDKREAMQTAGRGNAKTKVGMSLACSCRQESRCSRSIAIKGENAKQDIRGEDGCNERISGCVLIATGSQADF